MRYHARGLVEFLEERTLLTVMTFEKTVPPNTSPTVLHYTDLGGYGDRVNGATQTANNGTTHVWRYGTEHGPTPKVVASFGPVRPTASPT